eukprot:1137053-Pelagomonas_calceolata.AAC.10
MYAFGNLRIAVMVSWDHSFLGNLCFHSPGFARLSSMLACPATSSGSCIFCIFFGTAIIECANELAKQDDLGSICSMNASGRICQSIPFSLNACFRKALM